MSGQPTGPKCCEVVSDPHDIQSGGTYNRNHALQLERINVCYNEAGANNDVPVLASVLSSLAPWIPSDRALATSSAPTTSSSAPAQLEQLGEGRNKSAKLVDSVLDVVRGELGGPSVGKVSPLRLLLLAALMFTATLISQPSTSRTGLVVVPVWAWVCS